MTLNSCGWDDDSLGVEGLCLEFLNDMGGEVIDVGSVSLDRIS